MSSQQASPSGPRQCQEFLLRVPKNNKKRFHVMRFHAALNVDVAKWTQVKMERENNLKDFRSEEDMPKYGAGSEFGREQREEARRKKYGIVMKKYNPDDQPWHLRVGGKAGRKFRGIREGGIAENASYYVFVKAPDGSFEAYPVDEWYNFTPVQRYKTLNAEEAEEEFGRRDKVLNYFSIMLRKRLKNEDGDEKEEGEEKKQKKKSGKYGTGTSDFKISDMDDWINSSDADSEEEKEDEEKDTNAKEKQNKKKPAAKKKKKKDSDDEALEDSDDGDGEGREVDYISDESSDSEDLPEEKSKGELKGVEDEEAIRKMEESESEEENEEEKKENAEDAKEEPNSSKSTKDKKEAKKTASSSESSSDTSDSDDFDNDTNFHSAMFMQKSKRHRDSNSTTTSRSNTPTRSESLKKENRMAEKAQKRSIAAVDSSSSPPPLKKAKSSSSGQGNASTSVSSSLPRVPIDNGSDGITEDAVRRYLMRKPMTTTELLHKFKSKKTGLSREQMVNTIAQILKKLNPDKHMIKDKMYLSIKQT